MKKVKNVVIVTIALVAMYKAMECFEILMIANWKAMICYCISMFILWAFWKANYTDDEQII